ncbi:MAG: L-serine ammonia-lyase [Desulfovibrionaceae bacterium]|nr:L-serine ammonia-lyase [Desulfovibrionaceae bacterium]
MLSVFNMYKIGVGPSSSHTMGPMVAGKAFADKILGSGLSDIGRVRIDVYGSLALTGAGHGTFGAILIGLEGNDPKTVDIDAMHARIAELQGDADMLLGGKFAIPFSYAGDMHIHKDKVLSKHTNGMTFTAFDSQNKQLASENYYSIGGGFIKTEENFDAPSSSGGATPPFPFGSWKELSALCNREHKTVAQLLMENEKTWDTEENVRKKILEIYGVMREDVERGCKMEGILPGGLGVRCRAPGLFRRIREMADQGRGNLQPWALVYAMAVGEQNAMGARVVTAPTNGAAGIIPGVLAWYEQFFPEASEDKIIDFVLTSAAIGMLYQMNASIAGAEAGCQAEVGVSCSMAAGGLCAILGGDLLQIEMAAKMAMEHNLGLTCDPVCGLVQIPCIERNGMAAQRALQCAQLALLEGEVRTLVNLDDVVEVMYRTGLDLQAKYRETSLGGLAVVVPHELTAN